MVAVVSIPTRLRVVKEIQLDLGVDDHQDGCSRAAILKAPLEHRQLRSLERARAVESTRHARRKPKPDRRRNAPSWRIGAGRLRFAHPPYELLGTSIHA